VGTGTSFHAAELAAWATNGLSRARRARAAEPPRPALDPAEAVVLITPVGETAYSLRVREQVLAAGRPLVLTRVPRPADRPSRGRLTAPPAAG
jgi:hypothetical protein